MKQHQQSKKKKVNISIIQHSDLFCDSKKKKKQEVSQHAQCSTATSTGQALEKRSDVLKNSCNLVQRRQGPECVCSWYVYALRDFGKILFVVGICCELG